MRRPTSCRELQQEIEQLQSVVIRDNVQVIVIDSIAALGRKESLTEQEKELYLVRQAATLKKLGELCRCTTLVTNQITPDFHENIIDSATRESAGSAIAIGVKSKNGQLSRRSTIMPSTVLNDRIGDIGGDYRPAMGSVWYHCVTTRFVLSTRSTLENHSVDDGGDAVQVVVDVRSLEVVKSPAVGHVTMKYHISQEGLRAI